MLFADVAVEDGAAGMPALVYRLDHAVAALFEEVGDVELGERLLDASRENRCRVQRQRLVGREDRYVITEQLFLDRGRVRRRAGEAVDGFDDDRVDSALPGQLDQVWQTAVALDLDPEEIAVGAVAALLDVLTAAFDVPAGFLKSPAL